MQMPQDRPIDTARLRLSGGAPQGDLCEAGMSTRRFRIGQVATSVSRKFHYKRALVASMGVMPEQTGEEMAVGSRHRCCS